MTTIEIGGRSLELSRPDKVLFPDAGITKADLVRHYRKVAPVMLPHVRGRPVSMQRYPDGIGAEGFYHKDVEGEAPDWMHTERVEKKEGGSLLQIVLDDEATLVWLADRACITPHVWSSRVDRLDRPDRMIFDLDPPGGDADAAFPAVRKTARELRASLAEHGLTAFVMTSGSRGLHLHVPLRPGPGFDEVRAVARVVAEAVVDAAPDRATLAQRKAKRGDRIFIDVLRNAWAQTSAPPYSVRARPGAPVATPLDWDELGASEMGPRRYGIRNILRRLGQRDDPWAEMDRSAGPLPG